ncbi:MAG: alpha/beta fold hydrolase [Bdellovibrionales bacterium]|nr:alpha/beta fold hydrolase [Bdellovibrionales bacterium]
MPLIEQSNYQAPLLFRNGHIQTIFPTLCRRLSQPSCKRERYETSDGDFVDIDWLRNSNSKLAVLFHGLEGSSDTWYMRGMTRTFSSSGFDVACFNFRGCSGEPNRLLKSYHSGATADLRELLPMIKSAGSYQQLVLVGFSLGGNVVLKFLGEEGENGPSLVDAAVAISVPCDLKESADCLELASNTLYMARFMRFLRAKMQRKREQFPDALNYAAVNSMRTFAEFDDFYTAPVHGFGSAEEYWRKCSSKQFLSSIRVPALMLNAADDPFLGPGCYPSTEVQRSEFVFLETPRHGGHNGFVAFGSGGSYGSELRALDFVLSSI